VTSDLAVGRRVSGSHRSVRQRLATIPPTERGLIVVLLAGIAIHGARMLAPFFARGDLLYHWGLTQTILLGSFPPEGPYAGLPAYYPPGFHVLLAAISRLTGLDVPAATTLLGIAWLPVIPLGAYLLTRRLTGRRDVALVAAILTAFGGGFDVSADRLWVNSMFMVGQAFVPVYPRDLVFGILPFAVLAFLNATEGERRWLGWAVLAGALLGVSGLVQIQLLIPIPLALTSLVVVLALRDRSRVRPLLVALLATGVTALAFVTPWLLYVASIVRKNGGFSIDSSEDLLPVRIGFWQYPIQFGLILPLAVIGAGMVLLFLRRATGPATEGEPGRWAPRPAEVAALLLPWWLLPFTLAVLYQPTWPLEDALRPQRMWMVSSQAGLILAAIGLVALVESLVRRRPSASRFLVPGLVVTLLVACLPATLATERLLWTIWSDRRYAHLQLGPDRVPEMARLLDVTGTRSTVLSYEDWSSLIWYETGASVVAVLPPGYAKLAFDPGVFTGHGQPERRADLASAFHGDVAALTSLADRYGGDRIVLARRDDALGLISQPAALAATASDATAGPTRILPGNGWDAVVLEPGGSVAFSLAPVGKPIDLEIRVLPRLTGGAGDGPAGVDSGDPDTPAATPVEPTGGALGPGGDPTARRLRVLAGERPVAEIRVPFTGSDDFIVVTARVELAPGERLVLVGDDRIAVQSVTGFLADFGPPPGWSVIEETADAVVWGRNP
jgi:uncharacterized protein DUF6541